MDPQAILHLYDQEMRKDAPPGRSTIYQHPGLTYFTVHPPSPYTGWVIYTHLDPAVADQAIQSTVDFFRQYGGEFEWKTYEHDTPPDLKERLLAHGFTHEGVEAVLALDLETVPPAFWEPSSANVQRLTHPGQLADVTRILTEVWGETYPGLEEMLAAEMLETPDQISVYIVYMDGEPVSCAWVRYYPGRQFAELYGGATLEPHRNKGLYTALVKARAQEARRRGVRFLMVDASLMSRPVLENLGYVFLTHSTPFVMKFSQ